MSIKEKISDMIQKRVRDSAIKQIANPNSREEDIRKAFKKITDKIGFVKETFDYSLPIPQVIQEEITTFFMDNPNSIDLNVFYLLDADYQKKLQENLCDRIISGELKPSQQLFKAAVLARMDLNKKLNVLGMANLEDETQLLPVILSESEIVDLVKKQLISGFEIQINDEITVNRIVGIVLKEPTLINQDNWIEIFNELAKQDIDKAKELIKQIMPKASQDIFLDEVTEIEKERYLQERLPYSISSQMEIMLYDKAFKKYRIFRGRNFPDKQHVVSELLDSMKEFASNKEIITLIMNLEEKGNEKYKQLLVEYINDRKDGQTEKISNLEEIEKYPELVLQRQKKQIESGRMGCREVLIRNITGFSSIQFENLQQIFLKGHDIEEVLKKNNTNAEVYHIVSELFDFIDSLDDEQLKEFAQNVAKRNYNELSTQESVLISTRNRFKATFSNIVSEYGKEFNSELGYRAQEKTENGIKTIYGPFTIFISQKNIARNLEEEDSSGIKHICLSLISEGHYGKIEEIFDSVTYLFDYLPEDLMMLSSDKDMDSIRGFGKYDIPMEELERRSNFKTAQNTILTAKKVQNDYTHTESIYHMSGFDKEGNFVQVKPKAIGIWSEEQLTPELKSKADELGIEVVMIPDMQQNLSYMLENGQVTPSLVKGITGSYDKILTILEQKEKLEHKDFISIRMLQEKIDEPELLSRLQSLLQRKEITIDDIGKKVEDVTIGELQSISKETREFYRLINNQEIERGE